MSFMLVVLVKHKSNPKEKRVNLKQREIIGNIYVQESYSISPKLDKVIFINLEGELSTL